jgi:hypothetical protein
MKTPASLLFVGALGLLTLGFTGCTTIQIPQGSNTAYVQGIDRWKAALTFREERAAIDQIDGKDGPGDFAGFHMGQYVPAGKHDLVIGWGYHGAAGSTNIQTELVAGHVYTFNISDGPTLTLLDETVPAGSPFAAVENWPGLTSEVYDDGDDGASDAIVDVDFSGSEHVRPPFHPGEPGGNDHHDGPGGGDHGPGPGGNDHGGPGNHGGNPGGPGGNHTPPPPHSGGTGGNHTPPPSHSGGSGGPPSIPNTPRPSSGGGGGGRSSSGNSGGSSGHSGGGSSGGGGGGSSHSSSGGSGKKG